MAKVELRNLVKTYATKRNEPASPVVHGINLEVHDREFMVLVGPSGCGKSTTLRMIAGLEEISSGTVAIDGTIVNDVLPKDRDIAMVFQNYALYPHMSVRENLGFGLKLRKFPRDEIDRRVQEAAAMLGLSDLLARKPKELSGGQRQRVAVGRAIVRKPKVFLFDEPLSNLDAQMRVTTRAEISKLHARLGATMIYVTHDQVEAMTMGDRICVMRGGRIMQVAEPMELYRRPANLFVAGFIGTPPMNFFRGTLQSGRAGRWDFVETNPLPSRVMLALDRLLYPGLERYLGKPVVLGIRPECIRESLNVTPPEHAMDVVVELAEPMGAETSLYLHTGATSFIARVGPTARYKHNQRIQVSFDPMHLHFFDPETEDSIE